MTRSSPRRRGIFVDSAQGRVCDGPSDLEEGYPPAGFELRWIERIVPFGGREILEIGCADGRLTFQYAKHADRVVAVDPNDKQIAGARAKAERLGLRNVTFLARGAQERFDDLGRFDVAFFAWSL